MRDKELTTQIVVRVDDTLRRDLEADARENGRTVAQSVRHHLKRTLASTGQR